MDSITVSKIYAGTVYKIIGVGLVVGFFPIFLLFGLLGAADLATLTWNEQPVTGLKAIVVGPLMGVFFALLFTAIIGTITALGLWIFSMWRPLEIQCDVADRPGSSGGGPAGRVDG